MIGQLSLSLAHKLVSRLRLQIPSVVLDMITDEAGDKMVAVVISGLHTDGTGLTQGIAGGLQISR